MTEDAAVFGGQNNMIDGLANAKAMYKPEMIAVSTTCMAEVIGDDLNAFIKNTKKAGNIPEDFAVPFAHTPSFVGSHVTGYDNMDEGILRYFTLNTMEGKEVGSQRQDQHHPRLRDLPRQLRATSSACWTRWASITPILSDPTEVLDTPTDGEFRMYAGGTTHGRGEGCAERQHHRSCCSRPSWRRRRSSSRTPGTRKCPSSTSRWAWTGPTSS